AFFEQLAIRRAAVARLISPNVQMRVDVYREPFVGAENLAHRFAVRIRNVIAAAERYHELSVRKALFDRGTLPVVRFLERTVGDDIARVQDLPADIECRKFIELFADRIRSRSRSDAAAVSPDAFILRTADDNDISRVIIFLVMRDYFADARVVLIAARFVKSRIRTPRVFK